MDEGVLGMGITAHPKGGFYLLLMLCTLNMDICTFSLLSRQLMGFKVTLDQ